MVDETRYLLSANYTDDDSDEERDVPISINYSYQDKKTSKAKLMLAVIACVMGSPFQIGLNASILNAPADVIKEFYNETYLHRTGEVMSEFLLTILWAVTVASFCVGGMIGGVCAAYFAGKFGRKRTLLANNVVAFLCALLQGCSKSAGSFELLIAGRVVAGVCCGLNSAVSPVYLAEISPVSLTGFCGTCNQLSITLGVLAGEILGLENVLGTPNFWPILVSSPSVPAIYSLLTLTWCPESPRYLLINKGDDRAAENALVWLRKTPHVAEELKAMHMERVELRNSPQFNLRDLWWSPELRWPLIICIVLQMSQQFSGINAVNYYSTSIFMSANLSNTEAQYATVGTGIVNVAMTFVAALLMDRAGRRTLHMIGLAGMCVFSILLIVCLMKQSQVPWLSYVSIGAVVGYIIFFATGPGAIPWFIVAELFAQGPRTAAVSVSVLVNWFFNFIVGILFPFLQKSLDKFSFLPFTVMLALFFVFTFLFVPETKGKTTIEITEMFKSQTAQQYGQLVSEGSSGNCLQQHLNRESAERQQRIEI